MSHVIPTPAPLPPKQATQQPPAAPKPGATPLCMVITYHASYPNHTHTEVAAEG
jgi:hypothetical protein